MRICRNMCCEIQLRFRALFSTLFQLPKSFHLEQFAVPIWSPAISALRNFSTLYRLAVFFIAFGGAIGASMLGIASDRFGNYDAALFVIAASFISAGCFYLMLGRDPRPGEAD